MEAWLELGSWDDKWLYPEKSFQDFGIMMVKDLIDVNGSWRFDLLLPWLPSNIISKFHAIMPPNRHINHDTRIGCGTSNCSFSIGSAYMLLCRFTNDEWETNWRHI
ncbi:hypothetical protein TSUD_353140 [Trifolium subterraneum]|nr:hypothetical protein TSUD_353140 [Trifolium subterraneum]